MTKLLYCFKRGFANLKNNFLFTAVSALTIAACIFMFCIFYALIMNVQHVTFKAETAVGITVFFNEDASDEDKELLKTEIINHGGIREINYISADEAWEDFKDEYFGDNAEELAAVFADDNPLSESDSFEIFLNNIDDQPAEVEFLKSFPQVREVNYANEVVSVLKDLNRVISIVSLGIIGVLFIISIFLISNTISVAAAFRKRENEIMKLIGATNRMIRAPFVIEGTVIGFIGAAIPLTVIYFLYNRAMTFASEKLMGGNKLSALNGIFELLPLSALFTNMLIAGLILGVGMGFIVSALTIRKHLKV